MAAVGICGTDLHQVKGEFQRPTPMVLGHEGAGVVEAVGAGVDARRARGRGRALVGAVVRRVRRLPARPAGRVRAAASGDRRRHAGRRDDRHVAATARRSIAAPRPAVSPSGSSSPSGWRSRSRAGVPLREAALLGCAALTGVGAALFAAGVTAGCVGARASARAASGSSSCRARASPGADDDRRPSIRSRRGASRRCGSARRTPSRPDELEAMLRSESRPTGVDFGFDAVGDPATTRDRAPLHAERRHQRDRRAAGDRARGSTSIPASSCAARSRSRGRCTARRIRPSRCRSCSSTFARGGSSSRSLVGPESSRSTTSNEAVEASLAGSAGRVLVLP